MGGKRVVTTVFEIVTGSLARHSVTVFEIVTGNPPSLARHSVTVTEIVAREMLTAPQGVASRSLSMEGVSRKAMSAQAMAGGSKSTEPAVSDPTPHATHAMGSNAAEPMSDPTPHAASVSDPTPHAASVPDPTGDCRDVRDEAKRANSNARCKNTYCFLLHDAFPSSKS